MDLKSLINKYVKDNSSKKLMWNFVILALVGILIILIGNITNTLKQGSNKKNDKSLVEVSTNAVPNALSSNYEEKVKKELQEILGLISGVGKVSIMVNFEGGGENVVAVNMNDNDKRTEEKDTQGGTRTISENTQNTTVVLINEGSGSKPFVLKQLNPNVSGVIVIAEGAESSVVKERLLSAVKTLFDLPVHKVVVLPMKRN